LLSKGLNYVPHTNKINHIQLNDDIKRFERTLQIHHFFSNKNSKNNFIPKHQQAFSRNTSWWPTSLNSHITKFCQNLKDNTLQILQKPSKYNNLTKEEYSALTDLKKDKNIVIKKADKNAGIVIMNTIDYNKKINDLLSDTNTYTILQNNHTIDIK